MLHIIVAFVIANWPAIVAITPSIIVAVTKIETLPRWVSVALQVVSVLSHADAPGTFKLPGVVHDTDDSTDFPKKLPALVLLLSLLLASSASCSWFQKHSDQVTTDFACVAQSVEAQSKVLVPCLIAMATGGISDPACLESVVSATEEAIACAMQDAAQKLEDASMGTPPPGYSVERTNKTKDGAQKLRGVIARKGWTYKAKGPAK